jgi:hypothetical protein
MRTRTTPASWLGINRALRPCSRLSALELRWIHCSNLKRGFDTSEAVRLIRPDIGEQTLTVVVVPDIEGFEVASLAAGDLYLRIGRRRTLPLGTDQDGCILRTSLPSLRGSIDTGPAPTEVLRWRRPRRVRTVTHWSLRDDKEASHEGG